jgi:hypothetical protein
MKSKSPKESAGSINRWSTNRSTSSAGSLALAASFASVKSSARQRTGAWIFCVIAHPGSTAFRELQRDFRRHGPCFPNRRTGLQGP